jgi:N utilization substance protein B
MMSSPGNQPKRPARSGSRDRQQRNSRRHQARVLAMQILYEADVTDHSPTEILVRTRNQGGVPDETLDYASELLTGIRARAIDLKAEIEHAAPEFPFDGIAIIDRSVLQIAIFEAAYADSVPPRAAVNEAVEIAREYGGDTSARFVNGVLGEVIDRLRPDNRPSTAVVDV